MFPIEVNLFDQTFNYNPSGQINDGLSDEEDMSADKPHTPVSQSSAATSSLSQSGTATGSQPTTQTVDDLLDLN